MAYFDPKSMCFSVVWSCIDRDAAPAENEIFPSLNCSRENYTLFINIRNDPQNLLDDINTMMILVESSSSLSLMFIDIVSKWSNSQRYHNKIDI